MKKIIKTIIRALTIPLMLVIMLCTTLVLFVHISFLLLRGNTAALEIYKDSLNFIVSRHNDINKEKTNGRN